MILLSNKNLVFLCCIFVFYIVFLYYKYYLQHKYIQKNMVPEFLHCYFPYDEGKKFLSSGKFRLSSMSQFNDPFEFLVCTDYPEFFFGLNEFVSPNTIKDRIEQLKKENSFACRKIIERKANAYVNRMKLFRIGCFSETDRNILMWSHYGRKHTGLVVTFNTALDYWGNDFHQVNYSSDRINLIGDNKNYLAGDETQRTLLTQKASCWSYEKEWRYIKCVNDCDKDKDGYYKKIDPKCIERIVVGCKMTINKQQEIKDIANKYYEDVPVKIAMPSYGKYSLDLI